MSNHNCALLLTVITVSMASVIGCLAGLNKGELFSYITCVMVAIILWVLIAWDLDRDDK